MRSSSRRAPSATSGCGRRRRPSRSPTSARALEQGVLAGQRLLLRGEHAAVQLRAGLGRGGRAVLDQGGGGVGGQLAAAELLRGALEARDQVVEGVGGHDGWLERVSSSTAPRMPFTKDAAWAAA